MQSEVEQAALEIAKERIELDHDKVAAALAEGILNHDVFTLQPPEAIEAGVAAAIEEIDGPAFDDAFDAVQAAVSVEIEGQAKVIALRMLRELAAKAHREAAAAV